MKIITTLILIFLNTSLLLAQQVDSSSQNIKKSFQLWSTIFPKSDMPAKDATKSFPLWTMILPGATYFYDGRIVEGLTFSAIEIGGIAVGLHYEDNLSSNSSSPYYNYPLFLGAKTFDVDKCDWFRNKLELIKYKYPDFKYDPISESDLFMAPFKAENIFTTVTLGLIGLATLEVWLDTKNVDYRIDKVQQMYFLDRYVDRNTGLAIFSTASLAMSWSAGVSEEYLFRNGVMPILDYRYGQTKGLYYSSFAFGLMHLSNLTTSDKPNYGQVLMQVVEASLVGLILGKDVQDRNYHIGPAVAAHAWYDFTQMLGSFLMDPKNNVFAVQMKFNVQ